MKLNPWVDNKGILRVGGRLSNADLPPDKKNPVVLPYKHHVICVVIRHTHNEYLHAGNTLSLSSLRQKFWIIKGNTAVKFELKNCTICKRFRAIHVHQGKLWVRLNDLFFRSLA
jgi:hypothetical protein